MFERFTEDAREVVVRAQDEARRFGHGHLGTEHLLLGLLRDPDSVAGRLLADLGLRVDGVRADVVRHVGPTGTLSSADADALRSIGIDLDAVQAAVERVFGAGALTSDCRGHILFSRRAKKVLELAVRWARKLHSGVMTPEHMLLGLLQEGEGLAALILHERGHSPAEVRGRLLDRLGKVA